MSQLAICGGNPLRTQPFPKWPLYGDEELTQLKEVLDSEAWGGSVHGPKLLELMDKFAQYQGAKHGIGMNNGTVTMEIGLYALGVRPGDEVILPCFTMIATPMAPLKLGAKCVFVDIDPDTYNMDPKSFESAITDKTKAVIPVQLYGQPCDLDEIARIAGEHNIKVLYDTAQSHGAEYKGNRTGKYGDFHSFSFQQFKNVTAGEGGMLTCNDEELWSYTCWTLNEFGREPGKPWYHHKELAWNQMLSEFQAAIILAQMTRLDQQTQTRIDNAKYLNKRVREIEGIEPMEWAPYTTRHGYNFAPMKIRQEEFGCTRGQFIEAMAAEGIGVVSPVYPIPLYQGEMFRPDGTVAGALFPTSTWSKVPCPAAEKACQEEGFLILQHALLGTHKEIDDIVDAMWKIKANVHELRGLEAAGVGNPGSNRASVQAKEE